MKSHLEIGRSGEEIAREFLKERGYRIVAMNFIAPIGHTRSGRILTGEIDLIAYDTSADPQILTFIEVKTRRREIFASPESAVDKRKRKKIIRTARVYRRILGLSDAPCRFDVVSIIAPDKQNIEIRLFKGFFEIGPRTELFNTQGLRI